MFFHFIFLSFYEMSWQVFCFVDVDVVTLQIENLFIIHSLILILYYCKNWMEWDISDHVIGYRMLFEVTSANDILIYI